MREVERPAKVGVFWKCKRPCMEVFQAPLKLHINNPAEALSMFEEEHRDLLKLHVPFGESCMGKEKKVLSLKRKINVRKLFRKY